MCMETVNYCVEYWKHVAGQTQRPVSGGYSKTTVQPQINDSSRFTQLPVETIQRRWCQNARGRYRPSNRTPSCGWARRCCSADHCRKWNKLGTFSSSPPTYPLSPSRDGMHEIALWITLLNNEIRIRVFIINYAWLAVIQSIKSE